MASHPLGAVQAQWCQLEAPEPSWGDPAAGELVNRRPARLRTPVPAEEVNPDPRQMVESLRDFGYTLPSALADLIDNSLTAGAKHIEVVIEAGSGPSSAFVAVLDDGSGMDEQTLV